MKSVLWFLGGFAAVAVLFLMKQKSVALAEPVEELAHKLQDAWVDHHTVA